MIGLEKFDNLISLIIYFKDNATCKQFLKEQRWGNDVVCPYCDTITAMHALTADSTARTA